MTTATAEQERKSEEPKPPAEEGQEQQLAPRRPSISLGLAPRDIEAAWRFATMLADSSMVPKQFQGKPNDVIVALQHGVEVGLPPMAALQSICVINGRPGLWGDGLLGVIVSFPLYARHDEYYVVAGERCPSPSPKDLEREDTTAVSRFWRKGNPEPFIGEFSIGDAKKAGLWKKEGPWQNYPARMMKMRARSFAARDAFPDALRGIKAAEELLDTPDEIVVESSAPAEPVRRSQKPVTDASAELENELPSESQAATPPAQSTSQKAAGRSSTPAASTRKPDSKSQPGNGPSVVTENMIVNETARVTPKGQDPYWEIDASVEKAGQPAVAMIFITQDEAAYKMAASCAGTGALVNITWHGGKRQDGTSCKVLESIVAAN